VLAPTAQLQADGPRLAPTPALQPAGGRHAASRKRAGREGFGGCALCLHVCWRRRARAHIRAAAGFGGRLVLLRLRQLLLSRLLLALDHPSAELRGGVAGAVSRRHPGLPCPSHGLASPPQPTPEKHHHPARQRLAIIWQAPPSSALTRCCTQALAAAPWAHLLVVIHLVLLSQLGDRNLGATGTVGIIIGLHTRAWRPV